MYDLQSSLVSDCKVCLGVCVCVFVGEYVCV